ncbi:hypothetical protein HYH02_000410 [Chlamydomonas schloesseri]|uniref:Uncharacterized protein n=1 Tax=Chlamydomonas schloesseri TaxID=2026947 RepID=A0A836BDD9_9CHLO|nr:hypothetical protein HYH02_000410 [Chlamydomonas schloesseri]|eukprot:KAG2454565.1 hypothetical protein HYH02_000410 [Chlamydomonas schloesseri]
MAIGTISVLLRFVASLSLPPDLYKPVAVALMYFCRIQLFVFLLLRGPAAEPSHYSLATAFRLNIAFDLMMCISTLGCKPPSPAAELAVGTFLTAAVVVMHQWHAHRIAQAPPLYLLLLVRLGVMAINVYMGAVLGGSRFGVPRAVSAGAEAAPGSASAASTAGPTRPAGKCGTLQDMSPVDVPGAYSCSAGNGRVSPCKRSSAAGAAAGGNAAGYVAAVVPAVQTAAAARMIPLATRPQNSVVAAAAAAVEAGPASNPATALEAAVAPIQALMPNRPYRSLVRRQVVAFKVPWAEPEDIQPGFQQRLAELVAAKGLVLADVSVRRGCIELVVILQQSAHGGEGTGAGGKRHHQADGGLDAAALVRTLGLLRGRNDGAGDGQQGAQQEAELLAAVRRVRDMVLTRGAAEAGVHAAAAGAGAPRIVDVRPRVLHVPAWLPQADAGAAVALAAPAAGAVTLRVRVEWPVAAQGPAGGAPSLAMVLVQAGGVRLPVQVTASRLVTAEDAAAAAGDTVGNGRDVTSPVLLAEYDIALEALPPRPGSMMLELCGPATVTAGGAGATAGQAAAGAAPPHHMLAPMLAVADAAAATELASNLADWPSDDESQQELIELVVDLGTWADAATVAGAWSGGAEWTHLFGCAPLLAADEVVWSELLPHLISYCRAAGWNATADAIEADHRAYGKLQGRRAGQLPAAAATAGAEAAGAGAAGATAEASAGGDVTGAGPASTGVPYELQAAALRKSAEFFDDQTHTDLMSTVSVANSILDSVQAQLPARRRTAHGAWWQALLQVLGLSQRDTPAEAAAFRAFVCSWTTSLANIAQTTELLMVVALLSRGARVGQAALGGEAAIVLSGCGLGAAATLAWALLPAQRWQALALRLRVPRQLGYLVSKSLLGLGLARPPAGALAYAAGPGMLLMEGAILPGACLVSPAAAMAIACIKLPLNVLCSLRLGIAGGSLVAALIIGVRTELLGLLTNTAFHVYLRMRYQGQAGAAAAVPPAARERLTPPWSPAPEDRSSGDRGAAASSAQLTSSGAAGPLGPVRRAAARAARDLNAVRASGIAS